jgi:hypothetical protein
MAKTCRYLGIKQFRHGLFAAKMLDWWLKKESTLVSILKIGSNLQEKWLTFGSTRLSVVRNKILVHFLN